MDCFQDVCLACDRHSEGPYCSQACRLADLEKANSAPISPLTPSGPSWSSSSTSSLFGAVSGYMLFQEQAKQASSQRYSTASASKSLTPSSSRSSLASSISSSTTNTGMSQQARLELQDYFSSFDQTRAAKRRSSLR